MEVKLEYLDKPELEKIEGLILETRDTVNTSKIRLKVSLYESEHWARTKKIKSLILEN